MVGEIYTGARLLAVDKKDTLSTPRQGSISLQPKYANSGIEKAFENTATESGVETNKLIHRTKKVKIMSYNTSENLKRNHLTKVSIEPTAG